MTTSALTDWARHSAAPVSSVCGVRTMYALMRSFWTSSLSRFRTAGSVSGVASTLKRSSCVLIFGFCAWPAFSRVSGVRELLLFLRVDALRLVLVPGLRAVLGDDAVVKAAGEVDDADAALRDERPG